MFHFALACAAVDASIGRVDASLLPQQTLMELFLNHLTSNRKRILGRAEEHRSIDKWRGVTANSAREVICIIWILLDLDGRVEPEYLPLTVQKMFLDGNQLHGSINLARLPTSLIDMNLSSSSLSGDIDLTSLPENMRVLNLDSNQLCGSLNLEDLPETIVDLGLCQNSFSGTVILTRLPSAMAFLDLGENQLSGKVDVTCLPVHMEELHLSKNLFEGWTDFSKLPDSLHILYVDGNADLSGDLCNTANKDYNVDDSSVKLVVPRENDE